MLVDKDEGGTGYAAQEGEVRADLTHDHRRKIPALTGIRGYAALWVVLFHALGLGKEAKLPAFQSPLPIVRSGFLGVDLFFVLSGFVLMLTYGRSVSTRVGIRDFAIGRVFRIMPLNWVVLLLFAAAAPLMGGIWQTRDPHSARYWLLAATLFQCLFNKSGVWNTPAWSLSSEWVCYFGFPIMAGLIGRLKSKPLLVFYVFLPFVLLTALVVLRQGTWTLNLIERTGFARCIAGMVAGVALCRLCLLVRPSERQGNVALLVGACMLAAAMFGSVAEFLAPPAFALIIAACYSPSSAAKSIFGNSVAHWLGEISFSVYLLHWLLFEVALRTAGTWGAGSQSALAAAIIVPLLVIIPGAWLFHKEIEVPGQALGRTITARLRARDRAIAG